MVTGFYTDGSTQDFTGTAIWSLPDTVVAVINGSGLAAGSSQGTATIHANVGSLGASTTLVVTAPALVAIAVTPAAATIGLGNDQQYQAIGTYSDGGTQDVTTLLTWSSGAPAVATVTSTGLAKGMSQGSTTLTGTFESVSVSVTLTVAAPTLVSISVVPNAASLSIGAAQQLIAMGTYTDGSTQNLTGSSTWVSSNPNVIGVSSAGLATALAAGNATVTVTSGATSGTVIFVVTAGTTQANLNTSRYQQSTTTSNDGQILVAGGVNCPTAGSCTYLSSTELYDSGTSTFIVPAVPSVTGVADVFVFQADGTVQAIRSDGTMAWTANVGEAQAVPDFQGGLVVATHNYDGANSITKLDGLTGQTIYTMSTGNSINPLAHPDGTVFKLEPNGNGYSVVGMDATTGSQKVNVPFDLSTLTYDHQYCDPSGAPAGVTWQPTIYYPATIPGYSTSTILGR
jgi:hypothetical protein